MRIFAEQWRETALKQIKMEDIIKKFFYTGVGLVSLTAEKLQDTVKKLVDEEKISFEEGKRIVGEIMEKTNDRRVEFERHLKKVADELSDKVKFNSSDANQDLSARLAAIEKQLGMEDSAKSNLVKKAPNRSSSAKDLTKSAIDKLAEAADKTVKSATKKVDAAAKSISKTAKANGKEAAKTIKAVKKRANKVVDNASKSLENVQAEGQKVMNTTAKKTKQKVEEGI